MFFFLLLVRFRFSATNFYHFFICHQFQLFSLLFLFPFLDFFTSVFFFFFVFYFCPITENCRVQFLITEKNVGICFVYNILCVYLFFVNMVLVIYRMLLCLVLYFTILWVNVYGSGRQVCVCYSIQNHLCKSI